MPDKDDLSHLTRQSGDRHLWEFNWVRDLIYLSIALALLLSALRLHAIVQPVLLAMLFAYLTNPIIVGCGEKWGWSRLFSVSVLFASALTILVALGVFLIPLAATQGSELFHKLPGYARALAEKIGVNENDVPQQFKDKGAELIKDPISTLSYLWDGVVTSAGLLSGVVGTAMGITISLCLFPVYLFIFSWNWPAIAAWPIDFVPASRRERTLDLARKMDNVVGGYFRTRLIIAIIMGAMYAVGWGIAGVPYWLIVGMLGGLLGIIPYAATFAWIIAMLLRFLELENGITGVSDALAVFAWPTIVYAVVQVSDDWILTPWLQGLELGMNFATIILAVLVGGALAGLLGMLLAVPTVACLQIFWGEVVKRKLIGYASSH